MDKMKEFTETLHRLEVSNGIPVTALDKLCLFMKESHIYGPLFENYIHQRLLENVHPELLLNIRRNVEKRTETQFLGSKINSIVVGNVITHKTSYDQFYYMYRHETRGFDSVRTAFVEELCRYHPTNYVMSVVNRVFEDIDVDRPTLLLQILENRYRDTPVLRSVWIMESLEFQLQYEILIKSLETCSLAFPALIKTITSPSMYQFLFDKLHDNGDDDPFAIAIRTCIMPISVFANLNLLTQILIRLFEKIPNTLQHLSNRAEESGLWDYVMALGTNKNKKELLKSIVKAKDQDLIDRFFSLYKNYPEVKHLTPFI